MSNREPNRLLLPYLSFCSFLVGFDSIVTVPLVPAIVVSTGMPMDWGSLLYASYAIAYAISTPIMGAISDRWDRKKMLILGLFVFALGTVLTGFAETFLTVILFRILSGIGAGMIQPTVYAVVGDTYSYEQRGRAMGIVTGALIASAVFGVPIGGYIAELSSWNWTFWLVALLSLLTVFFIPSITASRDSVTNLAATGKRPTLIGQIGKALTTPVILFALLVAFLYYGGLQGMFALSGVYYYTFYHLSEGKTGLILMIAGIASVLGSVVGGKLADLWNKKGIVVSASLLAGLSVIALSTLTKNIALSIGIHIVWAAVYAMGQSSFNALVSELNPRIRGTVLSLNSSAMYAGGGLLALAAAPLLAWGGFAFVGLMCGVANLLVLLITWLGIKERTQASSYEAETSTH